MKQLLLILFLFSFASVEAQTNRAFKKSIKQFRKHYKKDFLKEERSPFYGNKKGLRKMKFFKPNASYKVSCTFKKTPNADPFDMTTYSGKLKQFRKYGILTFTINGEKHELSVYQNMMLMRMEKYRDHLFLPFKDETNDKSSYGGGRYIDLKIADLPGEIVEIDFNKCYNPWCAYSGGYNCPIPPQENHLTTSILAGEKKYHKKK